MCILGDRNLVVLFIVVKIRNNLYIMNIKMDKLIVVYLNNFII